MKNKIILLVAALVFVVACQTEKSNKEAFNTTFEATMKLHDEVMAKMGTINRLQTELNANKGAENYVQAAAQLEESYKHMMQWMRDFNEVFPYKEDRLAGKTDEEIAADLVKLKDFKANMEEVNTEVDTAVKNAETVLN